MKHMCLVLLDSVQMNELKSRVRSFKFNTSIKSKISAEVGDVQLAGASSTGAGSAAFPTAAYVQVAVH